MERIAREQMFMDIAEIVAKRGTCDRAYVGAVLAANNRIISIGYNGAPPGKPHCNKVGHKLVNGHCTNAIHAEVNCLDFAADLLFGAEFVPDSSTLYVTHEPCWGCVKVIGVNNKKESILNLERVVYKHEYGLDLMKIDYLYERGIELVKFESLSGRL